MKVLKKTVWTYKRPKNKNRRTHTWQIWSLALFIAIVILSLLVLFLQSDGAADYVVSVLRKLFNSESG